MSAPAFPAHFRSIPVRIRSRCWRRTATTSPTSRWTRRRRPTRPRRAATASVVSGRSLYAGAGNAPTPLTGEVIGILAGPTPADARSGLAAALAFLQNGPRFREAENGVFYLAHCAARTGTYLSRAAHIPAGQPLAYLIAPPVPALLGLDAALKAAGVELAEFYAPPTETNFAGALLTGTRSACLAACTAFAEAVCEAAARPLEAEGTRRNDHGI